MKKNDVQIKKYYAKKHVVAQYIERRFSGKGGKFIHDGEVLPILSSISSILSGKKKEKVLDVGSGSGRLTKELVTLPASISALDSSHEMLTKLKQEVSVHEIFPQSAFERIPSKSTFNIITSLRFFEHFSLKDQNKLLQNLSQSLVPNGHVVYASVNSLSLEHLLSSLFSYGRYNYFLSDRQYKTLFAARGFDVVKREQAFIFPRGFFLYMQKVPVLYEVLVSLEKAAIRIVPGWASYFVYTLQKK